MQSFFSCFPPVMSVARIQGILAQPRQMKRVLQHMVPWEVFAEASQGWAKNIYGISLELQGLVQC